jgi:HMG (high mobility group) box
MAMQDRLRFESEKNSYVGPWKIQDVGDLYDRKVRRPASAFLLYSNAHREDVKKKNPGLCTTLLSAILSKMWKTASEEEKEVYNER